MVDPSTVAGKIGVIRERVREAVASGSSTLKGIRTAMELVRIPTVGAASTAQTWT